MFSERLCVLYNFSPQNVTLCFDRCVPKVRGRSINVCFYSPSASLCAHYLCINQYRGDILIYKWFFLIEFPPDVCVSVRFRVSTGHRGGSTVQRGAQAEGVLDSILWRDQNLRWEVGGEFLRLHIPLCMLCAEVLMRHLWKEGLSREIRGV